MEEEEKGRRRRRKPALFSENQSMLEGVPLSLYMYNEFF